MSVRPILLDLPDKRASSTLPKWRPSRDEQMRDMAEVTIPDAILALDASQKSAMDVRPSRATPSFSSATRSAAGRQVIEWCESRTSGTQQAGGGHDDQGYLADALDAVTSDIGGVAQLTDLLDLQADAINDLDARLARARLDPPRRTRAGG